ncbi:MAG: ribulose-phosphate 3-epimerase [Candidatus Sumerlaeota bacterium]|nr:ribulose-phosphate 3-epimerase [Candidatus Sumerlaeota bacterium]
MSKYPKLRQPFVNPSLLSADFANLAKEMRKCERAGCKWIHLDIMDGHFVPNLTIGPVVVKWLRAANPRLFFDTHLMLDDPLKYAPDFIKAGSNLITIHQEPVKDLEAAVRELQRLKTQVGVSVKPKTPIDVLHPVLSKVDLVLIMSVEPGFGGQEMIPHTLNKVRELALLREKKRYRYKIEIDGGINTETIGLAMAAGTEVIVAGAAVFKDGKVSENLRDLRKAMGS